VRFWAKSLAQVETGAVTAGFWLNTDRPEDDCVLWVGAGTKDIGFSLTRLTFQITHATDCDTNAERDYIVGELQRARVIVEVSRYETGDRLVTQNVNHYVTDGDVAVAELVDTERADLVRSSSGNRQAAGAVFD
jgi:hypothetical protein